MSVNTTSISRLQDELRASKEELSQVADQIRQLNSRKRELERKISDVKNELQYLNATESSVSQFDGDNFPWSKDMVAKLKSVFKISDFRSHQKTAINATMSSVDLILVMPTGGGKSLCFQLPALLSPGITLVVSPLISLMEDQLQSLKELGVPTSIFNAQTGKEETKNIFQDMIDPSSSLKMLYVTPEKLAKSKRLMSQLEKMYRAGRFARLVIDEVHCVSSWGHDFRPDYKFLGIMKSQYPKTPIIGLTATATSKVIVDIQKVLNLEGCLVLRDSFYRPNLRYSVVEVPVKQKAEEISKVIKSKFKRESGIIYCLTVKDCEEVTRQLREFGVNCSAYHAQLDPAVRTKVQQKWCQNQIQVIIATVAFGMGINKVDVRFVIHYSMSKSVENYYQETGRAGRDGRDAECILFSNFLDTFRASGIVYAEKNGPQNVYNMLGYSIDQQHCRKQLIAIHFGDSLDAIKSGCMKCDNCEVADVQISQNEVKIDAGAYLSNIIKILDHAHRLDERMTPLKLFDSWFQKGAPKLRVDTIPIPRNSRELCEKVVAHLLLDGYLKEDFHFTPYSTISYIVAGTKSFQQSSCKNLSYTLRPAAGSDKVDSSKSKIKASKQGASFSEDNGGSSNSLTGAKRVPRAEGQSKRKLDGEDIESGFGIKSNSKTNKLKLSTSTPALHKNENSNCKNIVNLSDDDDDFVLPVKRNKGSNRKINVLEDSDEEVVTLD